jgi:hypothetical protein
VSGVLWCCGWFVHGSGRHSLSDGLCFSAQPDGALVMHVDSWGGHGCHVGES